MIPKKIEINFSTQLPFTIHKEGKWFISYCPILGVTSQGLTEKKAIENLKEALSLFLITCFETGTLDQVLKECGFVAKTDNIHKQPKLKENYIDVPFPLLWHQPERPPCHA